MEAWTDSPALRAERPLHPHTQEAAILGLSRPVYKSCCTKHSGVPKHGPSHNFLPKGTSLFTQRGAQGPGLSAIPMDTATLCVLVGRGQKIKGTGYIPH